MQISCHWRAMQWQSSYNADETIRYALFIKNSNNDADILPFQKKPLININSSHDISILSPAANQQIIHTQTYVTNPT